MGLSWFNRLLTKLAFKGMLIKSAYTKAEFEQMIAQANFSHVSFDENYMGFEITMTK